ncbi:MULTISPECIES: hypothetical protein [unclassified Nocardiopsis]|uniref:hypothetical protein n=1 Tax=unclassified Nocardiopsis TaxID=2649073 RepID=UPI0013580580|nr:MULTISPECIES: hypothetical protein [unclassified Nocardiopsis]
MPDSTYHQIHFAWAEPTLLGRVGPGPAASSLPEAEQPVLRSWRDRLLPALTADYRSALPGTDPADYPETLWARAYPDGQAALVYRWPGDVRSAHAWAIVGPAYGLTLPRVLSLHENPHTRPAERRPPAPGWSTMRTLPVPEPWESTAAPGAVRTRDRRAAETTVGDEPILIGAVAAALDRPDLPVHIALVPERADLWQAVQLRFLWGMHRILHDVLTPPRAIPAAGWNWSFSTYDPVLGAAEGQHLAFGPPTPGAAPFLNPPPPDHRRVAEGLVAVLREEGGDALAAHLGERGVPEAPTFADRRDLLHDWLAPVPRRTRGSARDVPVPDPLPEAAEPLDDLPEAETPGEEETGPLPPVRPAPRTPGAVPGGQPSLKGVTEWPPDTDGEPGRGGGDPGTDPGAAAAPTRQAGERGREALWPEPLPEPGAPEETPRTPAPSGIFAAPEPHRDPRRPRIVADLPPEEEPPHEEPRTPPDEPVPDTRAEPLPAEPGDASPEGAPDEVPPAPSQDTFGTGGPVRVGAEPEPPPESLEPEEPPLPGEEWTISASPRPDRAEGDTEPAPGPDLTDGPDDRTPADAPPLPVAPDSAADAPSVPVPPGEQPDYAVETRPDEAPAGTDDSDNWPTQYVDLPLSRLERWHARRGPEGARADIADARAAVRAERAELQRVREERDRYHAEVQDLRREVARLDRSWLEGPGADEEPPPERRPRRWPARVLVLVLLVAFLATGLEAGARFGWGTTDLLGALLGRTP